MRNCIQCSFKNSLSYDWFVELVCYAHNTLIVAKNEKMRGIIRLEMNVAFLVFAICHFELNVAVQKTKTLCLRRRNSKFRDYHKCELASNLTRIGHMKYLGLLLDANVLKLTSFIKTCSFLVWGGCEVDKG